MATTDLEALLHRIDGARLMKEDVIFLAYAALTTLSLTSIIMLHVHTFGEWRLLIGLAAVITLLFAVLAFSSYKKATEKAKWYFEEDGKTVSEAGKHDPRRGSYKRP